VRLDLDKPRALGSVAFSAQVVVVGWRNPRRIGDIAALGYVTSASNRDSTAFVQIYYSRNFNRNESKEEITANTVPSVSDLECIRNSRYASSALGWSYNMISERLSRNI
jgi:hypothetical protein